MINYNIKHAYFQFFNFILSILFLFLCGFSNAQSTYLPLGTEGIMLLDRLETKSGKLNDSLCLTYKTETGRHAINFFNRILQAKIDNITTIDKDNINQIISKNIEWIDSPIVGDHSIQNSLNLSYSKPYNFLNFNSKNFIIGIDPSFNFTTTVDATTKNKYLQFQSMGFEARGRVFSNISFYALITQNIESTPSFISEFENTRHALPGIGNYTGQNSSSGYNYLNVTGYVDFPILKKYINLTLGYGKNFIGDGIRSPILSDNSANYPYLKISTRIWKFNYQNLYLMITPPFSNINFQLPNDYVTLHHLGINITKWLNVGAYESMIFNRPNSYEIDYLNPIIFYKYAEQYNGNPDKAIIGFNAKAIAAKHLQFYGQFMLNEFSIKEFFSNRGYWSNKWGYQLGVKYFDALCVKNLDLQAELNAVRPYTYTHYDTIISYSNFNQALGNPLGSGYIEGILLAKYEPIKKLCLTIKASYYIKGADTGNTNYGNNIFLDYNTRIADYGIPWVSGIKTNCTVIGINLSYRIFRNVFFDFGFNKRSFVSVIVDKPISSSTGISMGNASETWYYFGIRLNALRRAYDTFF